MGAILSHAGMLLIGVGLGYIFRNLITKFVNGIKSPV